MRILTVPKLSRAFFLSCCLSFSLPLLSEKAVYPLSSRCQLHRTFPRHRLDTLCGLRVAWKRAAKVSQCRCLELAFLYSCWSWWLDLLGKKLDFLRRGNHRNVPRFRAETGVIQRLWSDWYLVWKRQYYGFLFLFLLENHSYLKISGKPVSELGGIALIYVGVRYNRFMSIMCMLSQFFMHLWKIIMKTPWEWMLFVLIWTQYISRWELRYCS